MNTYSPVYLPVMIIASITWAAINGKEAGTIAQTWCVQVSQEHDLHINLECCVVEVQVDLDCGGTLLCSLLPVPQ